MVTAFVVARCVGLEIQCLDHFYVLSFFFLIIVTLLTAKQKPLAGLLCLTFFKTEKKFFKSDMFATNEDKRL